MKHLFAILLLLATANSLTAQVNIKEAKAIDAKEPYENVKVIPVYTDENSSSFIILVKKNVRHHLHEYHTEVVTVLEGTCEFYLAGETIKAKAGDHIVIPPGTAHAMRTTSGKPLKILSVQSPEYTGQDRVFVKVEAPVETKPKKNDKKQETAPEDDGIPEYGE